MREVDRRLDLLGTLAGYYAGAVALALLRAGVFEALVAPRTVNALAHDFGLERDRLAELLAFLSRMTVLVERVGRDRYKLGAITPTELTFQLEKFIGGYADSMHDLSAILSGAPPGRSFNEVALATAFAAVSHVPSPAIGILQQMGCRKLLDLGCGSGSLLIAMAEADRQFRGLGLDESRVMCKLARSSVHAADLSRRVRVMKADARDVSRVLNAKTRSSIDALHGRSLLNAFFVHGPKSASKFLRVLRCAFPKRIAIFVDYYGELNARAPRRTRRFGLLQDMAQIASGQGVPAFDRESWRFIYEEAGCILRRAHDRQSDDIRWFIHEVQF